jgi:MFS family permease
MLSLVIATRLVPILLFGLIGGAMADRYDRKRILMTTQTVTLCTHLFLGIAVTAGFIEVWQVFVTAFVAGRRWPSTSRCAVAHPADRAEGGPAERDRPQLDGAQLHAHRRR